MPAAASVVLNMPTKTIDLNDGPINLACPDGSVLRFVWEPGSDGGLKISTDTINGRLSRALAVFPRTSNSITVKAL